MKKTIKINFSDFWPTFNKRDNYFYNLLKPHFELEISDEPDFLIYSVFGKEYRKYSCVRIFYSCENHRPHFRECDYAFTFDYNDRENHYRLPLYVMEFDVAELIKGDDFNPEQVLAQKSKFCNFVYSHGNKIGEFYYFVCAHGSMPSTHKRTNFFKRLSRYKRVDSGGQFLNNIGGPVKDKLAFIKDYKFTIAFENSSYPGYTTEKIVHAMRVHSLPIYWGNKLIDRDFNHRSFLNYYDFVDEDALIARIIELDNNDDLYLEYLKQPYYHGNTVGKFAEPVRVLRQFEHIFFSEIIPVAQKKPFFF